MSGPSGQALRHGMAGAPGLEIWGPYEDKPTFSPPSCKLRRDLGVTWCRSAAGLFHQHAGIRLDSIPLARDLYRRRHVADYRDWLGADMLRGCGAIGGSFVSDNIETTTSTRSNLAMTSISAGKRTTFIGKDALQKMKDGNNRKKGHL